MARRKIVWTNEAQDQKEGILEFWFDHNQSGRFGRKLNTAWNTALTTVSKLPDLGRITQVENVKAILVGSYYLFYKIEEDRIIVLSIWDTRRNPSKVPFPI